MDLDKIYKEQLPTSHVAGLRAVFQAGVESTIPAPAPESEEEVE